MDFWSYPTKAQQAVKVKVSVSGPCSPLTDPDPTGTAEDTVGTPMSNKTRLAAESAGSRAAENCKPT